MVLQGKRGPSKSVHRSVPLTGWNSRYFEVERRASALGKECWLTYWQSESKAEPSKGGLCLAGAAVEARADLDQANRGFFYLELTLKNSTAVLLRCSSHERPSWVRVLRDAAENGAGP
jgi:hypothetical protein